eukprot:727488-Hanusia_phi.AAC.1
MPPPLFSAVSCRPILIFPHTVSPPPRLPITSLVRYIHALKFASQVLCLLGNGDLAIKYDIFISLVIHPSRYIPLHLSQISGGGHLLRHRDVGWRRIHGCSATCCSGMTSLSRGSFTRFQSART